MTGRHPSGLACRTSAPGLLQGAEGKNSSFTEITVFGQVFQMRHETSGPFCFGQPKQRALKCMFRLGHRAVVAVVNTLSHAVFVKSNWNESLGMNKSLA